MIEERAEMSNPDLPAESVTIDLTVLFAVMDDMADAALALGSKNDADAAERAGAGRRCGPASPSCGCRPT